MALVKTSSLLNSSASALDRDLLDGWCKSDCWEDRRSKRDTDAECEQWTMNSLSCIFKEYMYVEKHKRTEDFLRGC